MREDQIIIGYRQQDRVYPSSAFILNPLAINGPASEMVISDDVIRRHQLAGRWLAQYVILYDGRIQILRVLKINQIRKKVRPRLARENCDKEKSHERTQPPRIHEF